MQAQMSSRRRIKAREKSIERKLPIRTFSDETRLTGSELLQVIKNKEVRWFKNGTSVPPAYLSEPFNPHKAKKIFFQFSAKSGGKILCESG